jgi:hypothetical protein
MRRASKEALKGGKKSQGKTLVWHDNRIDRGAWGTNQSGLEVEDNKN